MLSWGEYVPEVITGEERGKSSSGWGQRFPAVGLSSQQRCPAASPRPVLTSCRARSASKARLQTGAFVLEQKAEARESSSPYFSLWLWAGTCRHTFCS